MLWLSGWRTKIIGRCVAPCEGPERLMRSQKGQMIITRPRHGSFSRSRRNKQTPGRRRLLTMLMTTGKVENDPAVRSMTLLQTSGRCNDPSSLYRARQAAHIPALKWPTACWTALSSRVLKRKGCWKGCAGPVNSYRRFATSFTTELTMQCRGDCTNVESNCMCRAQCG